MGAYDAEKRFHEAVATNTDNIAERLARLGIDSNGVTTLAADWSNWTDDFARAANGRHVVAILHDTHKRIDLYQVKSLG